MFYDICIIPSIELSLSKFLPEYVPTMLVVGRMEASSLEVGEAALAHMVFKGDFDDTAQLYPTSIADIGLLEACMADDLNREVDALLATPLYPVQHFPRQQDQ